jgi:hypothetical protein
MRLRVVAPQLLWANADPKSGILHLSVKNERTSNFCRPCQSYLGMSNPFRTMMVTFL